MTIPTLRQWAVDYCCGMDWRVPRDQADAVLERIERGALGPMLPSWWGETIDRCPSDLLSAMVGPIMWETAEWVKEHHPEGVCQCSKCRRA